MRKVFFIVIFTCFTYAENTIDMRIIDNETPVGVPQGKVSCGGEEYSNCGEDIKLNFNVAISKIEENFERLLKRWDEFVNNTSDLATKHKQSIVSTYQTNSIENNILLENVKNNFYLDKQSKILDIEFDILKLDNELTNIISEIELINVKGKK